MWRRGELLEIQLKGRTIVAIKDTSIGLPIEQWCALGTSTPLSLWLNDVTVAAQNFSVYL